MLKPYLCDKNLYTFTVSKFKKMKIFTYILIVLAIGLIIFNITLLDFNHLTDGNSMIAIIGIVASICAVLILLIFKMSKSIVDKMQNQ